MLKLALKIDPSETLVHFELPVSGITSEEKTEFTNGKSRYLSTK